MRQVGDGADATMLVLGTVLTGLGRRATFYLRQAIAAALFFLDAGSVDERMQAAFLIDCLAPVIMVRA